MAIVRGRYVKVMGPVDSGRPAMMTVEDKDGQRENVLLTQIQFTESEKKDIEKQSVDVYAGVKVIKDADQKAILEGQDPQKIEERQAKEEEERRQEAAKARRVR